MGEEIKNAACLKTEKSLNYCEKVVELAARISAGLLSNGSSVGTAEQAAVRACAAYGIDDVQVCAVPSAVTLCAVCSGAGITRVRRIYCAGNDLFILESYGKLVRDVSSGMSIEDAQAELKKISCLKRASPVRQSFGGGLACGAFCAFFGGGAAESLLAFVIGFITSSMSALLSKRGGGGCARTFLLSVVGGVLSVLLSALCAIFKIDCRCPLVMLGTIMTLIPGLALCNSLRDVLCGDLFSGAYRILGGLAATVAIVAGYTFAGRVFSSLMPVNLSSQANQPSFIIRYISCAVGASGFCILMNAKTKRLLCGAGAALLSYSVYVLCEKYCGEFSGYFMAASSAYIVSAMLSTVYGIPSGVFLTPAIMPLLPGAALYYAVDALVGSDIQSAWLYGCDALYIFASIAAGLSAAAVFARILKVLRERVFYGAFAKISSSELFTRFKNLKNLTKH